MRAVLATFDRELRAYFFSPLAYVVLFFFLIVNGFIFAMIISFLNDPRSPGGPPLALFFGGTLFFWLILLFVGPVITMRLLSEELRSGSIEVLMTAPVTEGQVVAGKYLAALTFYLFLWFPTLAYAGIVAHWSSVDWGPVAAGYVGILGIGAMFLAVGLFASALSRSQLVAAIVTFAMLIFLFSFGLLENLINNETAKKVFGYMNLWDHMDEFAKGIVDSRRLVYYLSVTLFFLFLTSRALADKKWR
ncbi:MAG TPA: ABC transporter permease subunit [Thermoanaerobaculia bacterium]|nr:ABC transporter permease subunit [Thermoanaerobaculia bacterium]